MERGKLEPLNPNSMQETLCFMSFVSWFCAGYSVYLFKSFLSALLHLALCPQEADFYGLCLLGSLALQVSIGLSQWEKQQEAEDRRREKQKYLFSLTPSLLGCGLEMATFLYQSPQLLSDGPSYSHSSCLVLVTTLSTPLPLQAQGWPCHPTVASPVVLFTFFAAFLLTYPIFVNHPFIKPSSFILFEFPICV